MRARVELFVASFLMLFVELVLIRWLGAHIVHLSFFSNFVLLGSFLGIGLGFIRGKDGDWFRWSPVLLAFLIAFAEVSPVSVQKAGGDVTFFGLYTERGLPAWVMLPIVFLAVAATMATIAQGVAARFATFPPLEAYRLDILGSLAGIAALAGLSLAGAPPLLWGVVIVAGFLLLLGRARSALQIVSLVAMLVMLGGDLLDSNVVWSPYQRISVEAGPGNSVNVYANGVQHQAMTTPEFRRQIAPTYFLPYERATVRPVQRALIVGAGTGSDVAIALSEDVRHIDAVEIDPRLYDLGRDLHPSHPYQDPRVDVFIADGRAYLQRTDRTYDLILFALPDSLTLVAGQSSLRLESFLFTTEAIQEAKEHLAPGGVFAMYNFYREAWLADRLANTLAQVYGHAPCFDSTRQVGYLALITTSVEPDAIDCPSRWSPVTDPVAAPVTDDRPFAYVRTPSIPEFYLVTLGLILAVAVFAVRRIAGPLRAMRSSLDLFFMGVAFLLLETKNVVQFALLFGTTWFVNALVFFGILLTVLLAIEVARRTRPVRPGVLYLALGVAVAVAYLVPAGSLLDLAMAPRFAVATALAFAPVFFANLIFAERFQDTAEPTTAFGANLLGAMLGGALEYTSLVIGYRNLLLVAAAMYAVAFATGRRFARAPVSGG
jgi:spermidine synthase